ncbi:MAG: DarT ssDNA thymidine ADP-ribosyltransferase family protein [Myxococcota bacterium]
MDFRGRIRYEAVQRGIPYLVHFTQVRNLPSIVTHGLLSRSDLAERNLNAFLSDRWRLDEKDEAISVSISAVNYKMFQAKHRNCGRTSWVILLLDPSILWRHNCRFSCRNAARQEMKEHRGFLGGPYGFGQMFSDDIRPPLFQGVFYRAKTGIPDFLTTRPDAEVQVFGSIASDAILGAWVNRDDLEYAVQLELDRLPGQKREVAVQEFKPRFSNGYSEWG